MHRLINISAPAFSHAELDQLRKYFEPTPLDAEGKRLDAMWKRLIHHAGPKMDLAMANDSFVENLCAGEGYEDGHAAAFAYAEAYKQDVAALERPLLVMNIADDLFETSKKVEPYIRDGLRRDYLGWANGFLHADSIEVADEVLSFFDRGFSYV